MAQRKKQRGENQVDHRVPSGVVTSATRITVQKLELRRDFDAEHSGADDHPVHEAADTVGRVTEN
jgi:hypothetical protein